LAQSNPLFIRPHARIGRRSTSRQRPGAACRVDHHPSHRELSGAPRLHEFSKRGFMVLCMAPRFVNNEVQVRWDQIALDVKGGE
jgi:hypothetical protein